MWRCWRGFTARRRDLARNPQGFVPTLEVDGVPITQSLAIIDYLDALYPDPPMVPHDPLARARVLAQALVITADIHPVNNLRILKRLESQFGADQPAKDDWYRHWIVEGFTALEKLAGTGKGPLLGGDRPNLADVCLVPQMFNARRFNVPLEAFPTLVAADAAANAIPEIAARAPTGSSRGLSRATMEIEQVEIKLRRVGAGLGHWIGPGAAGREPVIERADQRLLVAGRHDAALGRAGHDLAYRDARFSRDDGCAFRQRLAQHARHAFEVGGQHHRRRRVPERDADRRHSRAGARGPTGRAPSPEPPARTVRRPPQDHQMHIVPRKPRQRRDHPVPAFLRREPTHAKQERPGRQPGWGLGGQSRRRRIGR